MPWSHCTPSYTALGGNSYNYSHSLSIGYVEGQSVHTTHGAASSAVVPSPHCTQCRLQSLYHVVTWTLTLVIALPGMGKVQRARAVLH